MLESYIKLKVLNLKRTAIFLYCVLPGHEPFLHCAFTYAQVVMQNRRTVSRKPTVTADTDRTGIVLISIDAY
jgi:hypothetical protein